MRTIYYESNIVVAMVCHNRLVLFTELCEKYNFEPFKLTIVRPGKTATEEHSQCQAQHPNYTAIYSDMTKLVACLKEHNFEVLRYKIEAVLLDERLGGVNQCE